MSAARIPPEVLAPLVAEGLTVRQIAERLDRTDQQVRYGLWYARLKAARGHSVKFALEDYLALARQGLSISEAAKALGVTPSAIYQRLDAQGLDRDGHPLPEAPAERQVISVGSPPASARPEPVASGPGDLDAEIGQTQGRYAALAEVAKRHGLALRQAQLRWHVLRSSGGCDLSRVEGAP